MDQPSAKRRRVTQSETEDEADVGSDSSNGIEENASPRRAPYAAATRASIARHNPSLLAGQDNMTTGDVRTEYATSSLRGPSRGLNPTALRPKMTAPRLSASPTREMSSSPSRRVRSSHGSLSAGNTSYRFAENQPTQVGQSEGQKEALPQEETDQERSLIEEENLALLLTKRGRRSRPTQAGLVANKEEAEPDLPPTPVELGLQDRPRPPSGVLSSSPRGKVPGRTSVPKSSPLKPRSGPSSDVAPRYGEGVQELNEKVPQRVAQPAQAAEDEETIVDDPEVIERSQRLDQFQKQLQALRSEVSFLQSQVMQSQEQPVRAIPSGQLNRLVNIITTSSNSDRYESSPLKPTSVITRLSTFLPFAKRPKPVPQDPLLQEEMLPSYKPIEGPLPLVHLQAFSAFSAKSSQQLIVAEDGALLNQHQLRLSASGSANLEMDFVLLSDTDTESIEQLAFQSITPWADSELGTWIRRQAEETADVAVIGWGSSRYLDLAKTRADCWRQCYAAFPQYITVSSTGIQPYITFDEDDDEGLETFLGKVSLQLQSRTTKSTLQISWHIDMDWIGDAESRIAAAAIFPSKWREKDSQRNSLNKIPETFQLLIGKVGVFEAIKVLVDLILRAE